MLRRNVLKMGLASSVGGWAKVGYSKDVHTLKFHTLVTPTSHNWVNLLLPWMTKIENESDGRIRFEKYPSMQIGGTPAQLFDQAKDGVADVVWTLPGYTPGRFPRSEVFELPFMMTDAEAASKALWEYVDKHARDEFRGVRLIALHTHGPGLFHTRDKRIQSPDDLRGLKLRGPTRQAAKLLGYLGATAVGMPLPQIPDALSKGVIGGCVIPWETVPAIKVHELTKYHAEFGSKAAALYTSTFVMAMNREKYDSLPPDLRKIIDANSGIEVSGSLGRIQQLGDDPGRKMAMSRGNEIHVIGSVEAEEFRRRSRQVDQEWVKDVAKLGLNGDQLLDSAKSLIQKYS